MNASDRSYVESRHAEQREQILRDTATIQRDNFYLLAEDLIAYLDKVPDKWPFPSEAVGLKARLEDLVAHRAAAERKGE